jgi:hypothetical protein
LLSEGNKRIDDERGKEAVAEAISRNNPKLIWFSAVYFIHEAMSKQHFSPLFDSHFGGRVVLKINSHPYEQATVHLFY